MLPPSVCRVRDYRPLAEARLDPPVRSYLQEGDDGDNVRALEAARLIPRPLCSVGGGHTRIELFGQRLDHPILLAPIAYQMLFHPGGEKATALASAAQSGQMVISSLASQSLPAIAHAATSEGGPRPWFQLYWQENRQRTLGLLRRAEANCSVIVFTVDAPIKRATLHLPDGIRAVNLEPGRASSTARSASGTVFDGWMAQAPTWEDLCWLREQSDRPLLVKGLLHADDAARALAIGCDGIVVSNHGQRILSRSPAALHALPAIVQRVAGRVPVLFDSGIRSGEDVFIALAHGATAVLLGRPYVWGLAASGALGVAHVLRLLRDELEMTMALAGCASLADIDRRQLVS